MNFSLFVLTFLSTSALAESYYYGVHHAAGEIHNTTVITNRIAGESSLKKGQELKSSKGISEETKQLLIADARKQLVEQGFVSNKLSIVSSENLDYEINTKVTAVSRSNMGFHYHVTETIKYSLDLPFVYENPPLAGWENMLSLGQISIQIFDQRLTNQPRLVFSQSHINANEYVKALDQGMLGLPRFSRKGARFTILKYAEEAGLRPQDLDLSMVVKFEKSYQLIKSPFESSPLQPAPIKLSIPNKKTIIDVLGMGKKKSFEYYLDRTRFFLNGGACEYSLSGIPQSVPYTH